ncbi:MAG: hypothetical protein KJO70_07815 [Gammaproteobacteria bacterium]|nr:hypothetical protein [Gammaproteobacteria bacterium]NNJ79209.1 hypothetical protein [Xanthomonadales bacterium]
MIREIFSALFLAAVPVGVAAYLMVWWALRNGHLGSAKNLGDIESEFGRLAKDKEARKSGDPVHRKWLEFGGGFYGLVALLTLVHIELGEIADFLGDFGGLETLAGLISINTLVNIFVETLQNTLMALIWPFYWLDSQGMDHAWLWLALAYAGYWSGLKLAEQRLVVHGQSSEREPEP